MKKTTFILAALVGAIAALPTAVVFYCIFKATGNAYLAIAAALFYLEISDRGSK